MSASFRDYVRHRLLRTLIVPMPIKDKSYPREGVVHTGIAAIRATGIVTSNPKRVVVRLESVRESTLMMKDTMLPIAEDTRTAVAPMSSAPTRAS